MLVAWARLAVSMRPTRILIGAVPEILRRILCDALSSEPRFEVVCASNDEISKAATLSPPDVAVTMIDNGVPESYQELFRSYPGVRLLGLKAHGRDAFLVELQPQKLSLGELSSRDLAGVVLDAANRPDFTASLAEM